MQIPEDTKFVTSDGFEICVLCLEKAEPPVLYSTDVSQKAGYIEGGGHTCANIVLCNERRNKKLPLKIRGLR